MADQEHVRDLGRLLGAAARAHHEEHGSGPAPRWAGWYAEWLEGKLTPHQARLRAEARAAEAEAERDRYAGIVAAIPDGNDAALLAQVRSELSAARRKLYRIEEMAAAWEQQLPDTIRTAVAVEALRTVIQEQP